MARVTNNIMARNVRKQIREATERLAKAQTRVSTGLRLEKPSDDPGRANRILTLRASISQNEQFQYNADHALSFLEVVNTAYQGVSDVMSRARDLAHMAQSDANGPSDHKLYAAEVDQLIEAVLTAANTDFAGVSLFAGSEVDTTPFVAQRETVQSEIQKFDLMEDFDNTTGVNRISIRLDQAQGEIQEGDILKIRDIDGNEEEVFVEAVGESMPNNKLTVVLRGPLQNSYRVDRHTEVIKVDSIEVGSITGIGYVGDGNVQRDRVGRNSFVELNTPGDVAFGRIFDQLLGLRDALKGGNPDSIKSFTKGINHSAEHMTVLQTEVGAKIDRTHTLRTRLEDQNLSLKDFLQTTEEVDLPSAVIDFQTQQALLNATLSTGARSMAPSLFNFV